MNTQHIHDLTLRLCQALDQNYDVVNMDSVISVISSLEGSPVTKEQLEATRLAKFINHLRRRTKDENLARRAKSLLKKWREMVGIQQQQVVDLTGLTSVSGKTIEQYHLRPRSSVPVELSMNFDATHHYSNSNSNQIYNVPAVTSATNDIMSSLKNITPDSVIIEDGKVHPISDKGSLESQYKLAKPGSPEVGITSTVIGIPPTSFQNVLSCCDVADYISMGMVHDGSINKATKSKQQHTLSYNSNNNIVDPTPDSQSERSESSYNVPVVIDIQDSNSCSDFDTIKRAIPNKIASIEIAKLQGTPLGSDTRFSLCSKSKKVKKEKRRKEKNDCSKPNIVGSNLFNQGRPQPCENFDKFETFVDRENVQSTHAEIPLLLDNSSMSSMFLPEGCLNTAEDIGSRRCLSTPDLTFTGKFQNTVISTPSNNLAGQNTQVQGQQESMKLHETKSPAGCIPLHPELVSETMASSNPTPIAMRDLPRKRGRKKGSKGVDSIIAKEGCRSSQMLLTPVGCGNKKVKTTKELFAEMQSRKWGAKTTISPPSTGYRTQQHQRETSRPPSSCSEHSRQSPRLFDTCASNAIMCTAAMDTTRNDVSTNTLKDYKDDDECSSETITSEHSRDSSTISYYLKQHSLSIESSSSSQLNTSKDLNVISQPSVTVRSIASINHKDTKEKQLREILKTLHPVQSISAIEARYVAELIPCTCKTSEILPMNKANPVENGKNICGTFYTEQTEQGSGTQLHMRNSNSSNDGIVGNQKILVRPPRLVHSKPNKSIFDLDFDEDEDPLDSLKAEATIAASLKENKETNIKTAIQSEEENYLNLSPIERTEMINAKITEDPSIKAMTYEVSPIYRIEYDSLCIAKQRFGQETQTITKFHLDALHNFLIPNVNGNWDVRSQHEIKTEPDGDINHKITENVVPMYSFLTVEGFQNNVCLRSLFKTYKPKEMETTIKQLCVTPYLGLCSEPMETIHSVLPDEISLNPDNSCIPTYTTEVISKKENKNTKTTNTLDKSHAVASCVISDEEINKDICNIVLAKNSTDLLQQPSNNSSESAKDNQNFSNVTNNISSSFISTPVSPANYKICCESEPNNDATYFSDNSLPKELATDSTDICYGNNKSLSLNIDEDRFTRTTLHQPPTPVSLKLKRKFQENIGNNAEKKRRCKKGNLRSLNTESKCNNTIQPNGKKNGIFFNGSCKTSYDRIRNQFTDLCVDDDVHNLIGNEADCDVEPEKRAHNIAFQREKTNLACDTEGLDAKMSLKKCLDGDAGVYERSGNEDDRNYSGDFHDVAVRDIPVPLTDRNHIVTMQRTSCEPGSPSQSHNATSSVSFSDDMISSQPYVSVSTTTCAVQASSAIGDINKQSTFESTIQLPPFLEKIITFDCSRDRESPPEVDLSRTRSTLSDAIEGTEMDLPKICFNISNKVQNDFVSSKATRNSHDHAISTLSPESITPEIVTKCTRSIKPHRRLFFPHEILFKDYDGTKRSILNISSCSSSCTEFSEQEYSNDSFTAVVDREPNTQTRLECRPQLGTSVNDTCNRNRSGDFVEVWKHLSTSSTTHSSDNIKVCTGKVHNNEERNILINECAAKQLVNHTLTLPETNADSNEQDGHMIAGTIDINMNCNANGEFSLQNNCLNKLNAARNCISQQNDQIIKDMIYSSVVAYAPSVDDNEPEYIFPNKTFVGYNISYDKNSNHNLITSFTNEPSLVKSAYSNTCNIICNEIKQHQEQYNSVINLSDDKIVNNICKTQIKHKADDRPDQNCYFYKEKTKICELCKGEEPRTHKDSNGHCARFQLFREWHQVLQLRSYNDEMLTVLPYVVFD